MESIIVAIEATGSSEIVIENSRAIGFAKETFIVIVRYFGLVNSD